MQLELLLHVDVGASTPIYQQLVEQISRLIGTEQLQQGDDMPSVRKLAAHFAVNPMTISKAYGQLEQQGWLERQRGKGMKVARRQALTPSERMAQLQPSIDQLLANAKQLGVDAPSLLKAIEDALSQQGVKEC
ncbi:GntR family transcriptional regulator [Salinibius halmophilus]|uniref:GntR family transcriptional regulator n=1 Tax=Salinibius halmophilus TaxID=1853216 RepID=UPI000E673B7D|nr:GntR family transcriptional regulator [Salinibius halmophilus]